MAEALKVEGLRELKRALKQLPKEIQGKVLQRSLRSAANLVRNTAKAMAPTGVSFVRGKKKTKHKAGTLRDSIVVRTESKKFRRNQAELRIGVLTRKSAVSSGAWYWRFVEFGTSNQSAQPFLVPAFESTRFALTGLIKTSLGKSITRAAKRVNRGRK